MILICISIVCVICYIANRIGFSNGRVFEQNLLQIREEESDNDKATTTGDED